MPKKVYLSNGESTLRLSILHRRLAINLDSTLSMFEHLLALWLSLLSRLDIITPATHLPAISELISVTLLDII
jgi:hypothetical protein